MISYVQVGVHVRFPTIGIITPIVGGIDQTTRIKISNNDLPRFIELVLSLDFGDTIAGLMKISCQYTLVVINVPFSIQFFTILYTNGQLEAIQGFLA